jgi:hypothetical protein
MLATKKTRELIAEAMQKMALGALAAGAQAKAQAAAAPPQQGSK